MTLWWGDDIVRRWLLENGRSDEIGSDAELDSMNLASVG